MPIPHHPSTPPPNLPPVADLPPSPPGPTAHRWLPAEQQWAIDQTQYRHEDALNRHGEYAAFILLWTARDEHAGLIGRCPACYLAAGGIADAYGQAPKARCPECFGTTFEGGYRAIIIRSSIWDFGEDEEEEHRRGNKITARASIQSTADFAMRPKDWIVRADGSRWQVRSVSTQHYHTGFGTPSTARTRIGGNFGETDRVSEESPAYLVRPGIHENLAAWRSPAAPPPDWSDIEEIRGPLVVPFAPADFTPDEED